VITVSDLPTLNALLNSTSFVLLLLARRAIRHGRVDQHKRLMIGVFIVSVTFLSSYLVYHYGHGSQAFQGEGWVRLAYFAILISHTVLATAIVPMAIITLRRGLRRDDARHKAIARWTYPIWLYVSVTGVMIYIMLYQVYPPGR
jgi:putative membrane protein